MATATTADEFVDFVRRSQVVEADKLAAFLAGPAAPPAGGPAQAVAQRMVKAGLVTTFQAKQLLAGKWRRFVINGKYKLLELIGSGGMGTVYLCEHIFMHRLVALKILPTDKLEDPSAVERFYREARAAAALDHPNIVRAYDIDKDDKMHYLVMEYIDGSSLQALVALGGPLSVPRAANYVKQAAEGLQHAHEAGLVHRDIKPGNLLIDRGGQIKILDLGLARFFDAPKKDSVTEKYDERSVMGTADYLSPEQAVNTTVDVRADLYSLGATFYFLLTGKAPFEDGTITQKLIWHQIKEPEPVSAVRSDVPKSLQAVLSKLMAKSADDRYQTPADLVAALEPWTRQPVPPPTTAEMPQHAPAIASSITTGLPRSGSNPGTPMPTGTIGGVTASSVKRAAAAAAAKPRTGPTKAAAKKPSVLANVPPWLLLAGVGGVLGLVAVGGGALLVVSMMASPKKTTEVAKAPAPPVVAARVPVEAVPTPAPAVTPPKAAAAVVAADDAAKHVGEVCVVELTVASVGQAKSGVPQFLNSKADRSDKTSVAVVIQQRALDKFKAAGIADPREHYKGKTIRVRGKVSVYQGDQTQLVIDGPDQIEVVK